MLLGSIPGSAKKKKHVLCHSSTIHNSQELEGIQTSMKGRMDKQDAVYTCSGILCSSKNEGNFVTRHNTDEPQRHYAE